MRTGGLVVMIAGLVAIVGVGLARTDVGRSSARDHTAVSSFCSEARQHLLVVRDACRQVPGLGDPNISETDAANGLREWAVTWIPLAATTPALVPPDYWRWNVDKLYRRLRAGRRGVFCFGAAWTLQQLYRAVGLQAWTFTWGLKDPLTHTSTLVRADGKTIVEDVYLDNVLTDAKDNPLDITEAVDLLHARLGSRIVIDQPARIPARRILVVPVVFRNLAGLGHHVWWPGGDPEKLTHCRRTSTGFIGCSVAGIGLARYRYWIWYAEALQSLAARGWPRQFQYLMLYPTGLSSNKDGWTPICDRRKTPSTALLRQIVGATTRARAPEPTRRSPTITRGVVEDVED